ncbi:MAG: ectoine synthase [Rhodoferax sp.]|jgi:L-ectoine synthase|uniref:ectoine synthase n=1 Tax=Rhodoferax sp. TaxID=50421 RepID=UPI001B5A6B87|nr:ectoine synthase [Rhodoferax sp.]MBP9907113.1 ectoine synthase [Rhodoferax sp.]
MFIRTVAETAGTDLDVPWGNGQSRRLVVKRDGMGFAVAYTLVLAGSESLLEYKNHFEACYCISGEGEVEDMAGTRYPIQPGTIYVLNEHDKHYLRANVDMVLLSVFNPPIEGHERHNLKGDGSSAY